MRDLPRGWEEIYAVVRRIPHGRVATYGQVAAALGKPRGARQVGYALAALRGARHDVPWQRVLGARPRGRATITILDPMGAAVQEAKLREEGVRFDERGTIDLARYGWRRRPSATRPSPAPPSRSRRRTAGWSGRRRTSRSGPR
jgi:methylated-DNA-protein-cysteine methyltransferase-like protein